MLWIHKMKMAFFEGLLKCQSRLGIGSERPLNREAIGAALSRRELGSQAVRIPFESGFSREESNAVHGTGCAGVRGQARSHRDRASF